MITNFAGAIIGFAETYYEATEGDPDVEVCLQITDIADTVLECDVTVHLGTIDGEKTGT